MTDRFILVLDAGTTSTRAMLYLPDGRRIATAQADLTQYYPRSGWVEQDAEEIWQHSLACARRMVERAGGVDGITAIGITNQRETVVAWDRSSGEPLHRAIVWQDRRTAAECEALREAGHEPMLQRRTGLVVDPYFSATKMRWLLDHASAVGQAGERLALGTVESWLVWKLTGGLHITDASNASRTQLMALDGDGWDSDLCALFGVPSAALPEIVDNAGVFGEARADVLGGPVPICGLAGDQQAATIGQACLRPGDAKATLGTGAFILANMGEAMPTSRHRLLGTLLYRIGERRAYALEGSIFVAGSLIQWLRDRLGLIEAAEDSEALARSVPDNGGLFMLPALVGLGAPHWRPQARGAITGLTQGTTRAHIVRAALESLSHQIHDLADAFAADGAPWRLLRVDGGMSANDWIVQDMANMLNLRVDRPSDVETTALGAAMLAGLGAGLFGSLEEASSMASQATRFVPDMGVKERAARLRGWHDMLAAHA